MKSKLKIAGLAALVVLVGSSLLLAQTTTNKPANPIARSAAGNNSDYSNAVVEINDKYNRGLLGKDQAIMAMIVAENKKSQDFYGAVMDQYGKPIAGVSVAGNLLLSDGTYGGFNVKKHAAETDKNGFFEFTGIYGSSLNVLVNKAGYKMGDRGEGYRGPVGEKSSPADRAILTMWKIHGPEPLTGSGIDAKIPYDGTPTTFDMATGKESVDGGFRVTFSRFPLEVRRRDQPDWKVKIEILGGGLIEENDPYPYLAPENGYKPSLEFNVSSNDVAWHPYLDGNFYVKNTQGQYGLMKLHINSTVTPVRLKADFTLNPSDSRNLEPDFSKQQ